MAHAFSLMKAMIAMAIAWKMMTKMAFAISLKYWDVRMNLPATMTWATLRKMVLVTTALVETRSVTIP